MDVIVGTVYDVRPWPEIGIACGLPAWLSAIVSVPERVPACVGVNV